MEEKYGFVYIWIDRKYKRYYIGCHWGMLDDEYICSSVWMKNSYRNRPNDFKRRILGIVKTKTEMFELEYQWLKQIKKEELGKKYYNFKNTKWEHWSQNEDTSLSTREKLSNHKKNYIDDQGRTWGWWSIGRQVSKETKEKLRQHNLGNKHSEETCNKMSVSKIGKPLNLSDEERQRRSEQNKQLHFNKTIGMYGKKHSIQTIEKMKSNNAMNNPEYIAKVTASKHGIKYLILDDKKKMAVPGSDKWNLLISEGFSLYIGPYSNYT